MKKIEKTSNEKLKTWQILCLLGVFLLLFGYQYGYTLQNILENKVVSRIWYKCIEYTLNGELYSGHMECARGPIFFYTLGAFKYVFGDPDGWAFQFSMKVFLFSLQVILLLVYLKIIKKLLPKKNLFYPLLFFLLFVFNTQTYSLETYMALIFMGLAYFFLQFGQNKYRLYLVGILMALAFFLNVTTLLVFSLAILCYFIFDNKYIHFHKKQFTFKKNILIESVEIILGFIAIFLGFVIFEKNVLIYHLIVHLKLTTTVSYLVSLEAMFLNFTIKYYMVYLLVGLLIYFFFKEKKSIYALSALSLFFGTLQMTKSGFLFTRTLQTGTHYILSSLFFVSIALSVMMHDINFNKRKKTIYALLFLIIIFPGYVKNPVQENLDELITGNNQIASDANKIRLDVEGVLGYIINNGNITKILYETSGYNDTIKYLQERGVVTSKIELDSPDNRKLGEGDLYDPTLAVPLKKLLGNQYIEWQKKHPIKPEETGLGDYSKKVSEGYYDLIIEGPPSWAATIEIMKDPLAEKTLSGYCKIIIPDLTYFEKDGMHYKILLIKDQKKCQNAFRLELEYYQKKYQNYCNIDQEVANERVSGILQQMGIKVPACSSGKYLISKIVKDTTTDNYKRLYRNKNQEIISGLLVIAAILILLIESKKIKIK